MTAPVLADVTSRATAVLPVLREHAASSDADAAFPAASLRALREHRLLGLMVPEQYGGSGASLKTFVEVAGQLAGACLSTAQIWAMHCFQVDSVMRFGSPELRASLLPRIADEQVYIASVTSERGHSSSLFTAHSPLVADGGHAVVERSAPVVTGGAHADGYLITMRASGSTSEQDVAWVYADRADLDHVERVGVWNTMGMRATESMGLTLSGRVPAHNVLDGDVARESMIPLSHLGWSACWLGAARGALSELVRWFRKSGKLGEDGPSDLFCERLARIRLDLELVSAYLTRVREQVDDVRAGGGSLASPRTQLQLNALKLTSSDLTFSAVDRMVQLAGLRIGYDKNSPVALERHFRDLRAASMNHANDGLWVGVGAMALVDQAVNLI